MSFENDKVACLHCSDIMQVGYNGEHKVYTCLNQQCAWGKPPQGFTRGQLEELKLLMFSFERGEGIPDLPVAPYQFNTPP